MAQLLTVVGNLFMHSDSTRQSEIWPKYSLIPSLVTRYSIVKDSRAVLCYCIDKLLSAGTNSFH